MPAVGERAGSTATVTIAGRRFCVEESEPLVFGRADAEGVVGLDASDMGISAHAGSVEHGWGLWWVVNRSRKRPLLLETAAELPAQRLDRGGRIALTTARSNVLVPGAIYTHRIVVELSQTAVDALRIERGQTTGTVNAADVELSERDRTVLTALCSGYLRPFPRSSRHPLSYRQVAALLGPPWTPLRVRKQVERFKSRMAAAGMYFEGQHANAEMAAHLVDTAVLTASDLHLLPGSTP